jgi:NAD(P)-dependent dehydrogenase (short-subunit alcohol dehydrogenase family)
MEKIALVTGASRGIGRAIATELSRRGWAVAIGYRVRRDKAEELARQHHIQMPMDQLLVKAEAFAIRAGGRSPRVAKQFIEQCEAGVQK